MDNNLFTGLELTLQGHLRIVEYQNRAAFESQQPMRVLLNRRNAVHKEDAAIMIVEAITDRSVGPIAYMFFGNGGTDINDGVVVFKEPNVSGRDRDLYNPIYFRTVDDRKGALIGDSMTARHISNSYFSDAEFRCLIGANEPFGQLSANTLPKITEPTTIVNLNTEQFAFDEIGLKLADGTLITHVIFVPIVKTASSLIEVVYTLRVAVSLSGSPAPPPPAPPPAEECHPAVHFDVSPDQNQTASGLQVGTELGSFYTTILAPLNPVEAITTVGVMSPTIEGFLEGVEATTAIGGLAVEEEAGSFTMRAVELQGQSDMWNVPVMSDTSVGTLSCWLYIKEDDLITKDFFGVWSSLKYVLSSAPIQNLFFSASQLGNDKLSITNITSATQAVITIATDITGINIGSKIRLATISQSGWSSLVFNQLHDVVSTTSSTITINTNTTGFPAWNSATDPLALVVYCVVTNISSTNPAVITFSSQHGFSTIGANIRPSFFQQTGWGSFDYPGLNVLSVTPTTITVDLDASARPAYNAPINSVGMYVVNALLMAIIWNHSEVDFKTYSTLPTGRWFNLLVSWDVGQPVGQKKISVYFDDTAVPIVTTFDTSPSRTITYSSPTPTQYDEGWNVLSGSAVSDPIGHACYVAGYWFDNSVFMDFSQDNNRANFHDLVTGKPVSVGSQGQLPTGTTPVLYLSLEQNVSAVPDPIIGFLDPVGNGGMYFATETTLTGVADSTSVVFSFWADRNYNGYPIESAGLQVSITNYRVLNNVSVECRDTAGNVFAFNFDCDFGTGANVRVAIDTNHVIGSKVVAAYVGTNSMTITVDTDDVDNLEMHWDQDGNGLYLFWGWGYVAEFWFGINQFFDPINKFVDSSGNPVDLGSNGELVSGTIPTVYLTRGLSDPVTAFNTNHGAFADNFLGAETFSAETGTRFTDNLSGRGHLKTRMESPILIAPSSPSD